MKSPKSQGLKGGLTNYGDKEFSLYLRRTFAKSMGYSDEALDRPIVGICYTESGFNNCHRDFPQLRAAVERGVLSAGALPVSFPVISLGESFLNPTSMLFRNLMSMDVEEMIRAQPMDTVVLMGGCDKTVPALLMGAISANKPAILVVAGPMMTGRHRGERLGACTDCRRFWARYRNGEIDRPEIDVIEGNLAVTAGTCAVMGTASSMALIGETLGIMLPNTATIPSVHADRLRAAEASGSLAAKLAGSDLTPKRIMDREAIENSLRVLLAVSGSTNAVIHLAAIAGRLGIKIGLDLLNRLSDETPVLVNLKPVGNGYMEDLHAAGGLEGVLRALEPMLNCDTRDITGQTLRERLSKPCLGNVGADLIRALDDPIDKRGGLIALHGSLAPGGAILKRAAASPQLLEHRGRAVVFNSLEDLAQRIDDPNLDVEPQDVLVLQNAGPKSSSGMPEAGYLPIPRKLAQRGVKDMVRVSDARMSGTAFGTVVLHITPEAADGGPLALVRTGDYITLSAERKNIELLVSKEELNERARHIPQLSYPERGYAWLYRRHVTSASDGCDFDFLRAEGI